MDREHRTTKAETPQDSDRDCNKGKASSNVGNAIGTDAAGPSFNKYLLSTSLREPSSRDWRARLPRIPAPEPSQQSRILAGETQQPIGITNTANSSMASMLGKHSPYRAHSARMAGSLLDISERPSFVARASCGSQPSQVNMNAGGGLTDIMLGDGLGYPKEWRCSIFQSIREFFEQRPRFRLPQLLICVVHAHCLHSKKGRCSNCDRIHLLSEHNVHTLLTNNSTVGPSSVEWKWSPVRAITLPK